MFLSEERQQAPPHRLVGARGLAVGGAGPLSCAGAGVGEHGAPLPRQKGWLRSQLGAGAALWLGPSDREAWAVWGAGGEVERVWAHVRVRLWAKMSCVMVSSGRRGIWASFLLCDHSLPCQLMQTLLTDALLGDPELGRGDTERGLGGESMARGHGA